MKTFDMRVVASDGPSFGAYLEGTAKDGEAWIALNVKLCIEAAKSIGDENPRNIISETLAHEVLHACQDVMEQELTENDIHKAMESATGQGFQAVETTEDIEQMIQEMTRQIEDRDKEIIELKAEIDKISRN